MPLYDFVDADGEPLELYLPMAEAPELGSTTEIDGREVTRVVTPPRTAVRPDRHFVAWSQPTLNADGTLPPDVVPAPRYDRDPSSVSYGHAQFSSRREVDEYVARCEGRVILDR